MEPETLPVCLVYARSPYDAIEQVRKMEVQT